MNEVKKIIVHMGFHKTGTSSLQSYLRRYKNELKPYADIYLHEDFGHLGETGRAYARFTTIVRRLLFRRSLRNFLASIPNAETLVMSRETFCGIMPGHRRFECFGIYRVNPVAKILAREMVHGLRNRFGYEPEIILLYTTRDRDEWIQSAWGHVVRSIRMTLNKDQFAAKLKNVKSLEKEVKKIQEYVNGAVVISASLGELKKHPLGPANAVVSLLDLPSNWAEKYPMKTVNNVGYTSELQQRFLEMNRNIKDKKILVSEKARLVNETRAERGFKPKF